MHCIFRDKYKRCAVVKQHVIIATPQIAREKERSP